MLEIIQLSKFDVSKSGKTWIFEIRNKIKIKKIEIDLKCDLFNTSCRSNSLLF